MQTPAVDCRACRNVLERKRDTGRAELKITRDPGSGSALNRMVYNRDLGAVLAAAGVAVTAYAFVLKRIFEGWQGIPGLVIVFGLAFWILRMSVFREAFTLVTMEKKGGRVRVVKTSYFGEAATEMPLGEWGYVRVDEVLPRDTEDLKEIYRWQEMAEPGVHAVPVPLYRVVVVGKDGRDQVVVHEGQDMGAALDIKRELTDMRVEVSGTA